MSGGDKPGASAGQEEPRASHKVMGRESHHWEREGIFKENSDKIITF